MSADTLHVLAATAYLAMAVALVWAIALSTLMWRAREAARLAFGDLRSAYRRKVRRLLVEKRRAERRRERERKAAALRDGAPEHHETHLTMRPPPLPDGLGWEDDDLLTEQAELPDFDSRQTRLMPRRRPPDE